MPSFPSLTFPNHFTLVTGLYPSEHGECVCFRTCPNWADLSSSSGIVGNNFYDPVMQKEFTYADPSLSMVSEASCKGLASSAANEIDAGILER